LKIPTNRFDQLFTLENGKWGEAEYNDIIAVLQSVLNVYSNMFGEDFIYCSNNRITQILCRSSGPFTAFDNSVMHLNVQGRLWSKYMYQFSHEMYHYLTNYHSRFIDNSFSRGSRHLWFEEAICEVMSIIVIKEASKIWKISPPYVNWIEYADALSSYSDECIKDNEKRYNNHCYPDLHIAIDTELKNLISYPSYPNNERHIQNKIANYIVKYYTKFGYINIINTLKILISMAHCYDKLDFSNYIFKWYELSDDISGDFVKYISRKIGINIISS
jgi:hypothetical protein